MLVYTYVYLQVWKVVFLMTLHNQKMNIKWVSLYKTVALLEHDLYVDNVPWSQICLN